MSNSLNKLTPIFLTITSFLLIGYAFAGRGFAYMGIPPIFVGEIVLSLGMVVLITNIHFLRQLNLPLKSILIVFFLWGLFRTIPYLGTYGINALRDGVIWGYCLFALLVALALIKTHSIQKVPEWYQKWMLWFLNLMPIVLIIYRIQYEAIPRWPWGPEEGVPIINPKAGDIAVHLAGIMAFMLLGLDLSSSKRGSLRIWLRWLKWGVVFVIVAFTGRSAFVTIAIALLVLFTLRPLARWGKLIILGLLAIVFFSVVNVEFDLGVARKISVEQFTNNIQSIFRETGTTNLEGSKRWRLMWWGKIINYTIWGDYFWTGKGFGINLANEDGFQVDSKQTLRSPHNGHLAILARAGVPGFIIWILLQTIFALLLIKAYYKAKRLKKTQLEKLNLWVLVYWSAFMVNASFDVFLEGPQGGIWFWCLFGFGIALLNLQRQNFYNLK